jgi:hypothetical protein
MRESIHFPNSLNVTFIYNLSRILNKKSLVIMCMYLVEWNILMCSFVSENILRRIECNYELCNLCGGTYNLNDESGKTEMAVQNTWMTWQ